MVTGDSQEEVLIFRDRQTDKHFIIIYISPLSSSLSSTDKFAGVPPLVGENATLVEPTAVLQHGDQASAVQVTSLLVKEYYDSRQTQASNQSFNSKLSHSSCLYSIYSLCVVGDEKGGLDPPAYTGLLFNGSGGFCKGTLFSELDPCSTTERRLRKYEAATKRQVLFARVCI